MFVFSSMQILSVGFAINLTSIQRKSFYSNKLYLLYFCSMLYFTISLFTASPNDYQNFFGNLVIIDEIIKFIKDDDPNYDDIIYDYNEIKNEKNRTFMFGFVFINFIITIGIEKFFNYIFNEVIEEGSLLNNNPDIENENDNE